MNLEQRFLKMDTAALEQYLTGAQQRTSDKNRMVASAAAHSIAMIQAELARRSQQTA